MAAKEHFSLANEAFVAENYTKAIDLYGKAIDADNSQDEYYVARAHARIKIDEFQDAVSDSIKAIEINPENTLAYLRQGIALLHLEDYNAAEASLQKGKSLDDSGNGKNFDTWLKKCEIGKAKNQETSSSKSEQTVQDKSEASGGSSSNSTHVEPVPMPTGLKTKYDWYQTETHVVITILVKNVKKEDCRSDIQERVLGVMIRLPSGSDYSLQLDLSHPIVPAQSTVKILSSKVEVKLKKLEGIRWSKLEGEEPAQVKQFSAAPSGAAVTKYPSSSHYTRDWDKLVTEIKQEEKSEKSEGDAAVNDLFQQIYADGSDEVKKAMNKSFVESGGTVLSTNWKEIGNKKTDVKPPDGMEHKHYES